MPCTCSLVGITCVVIVSSCSAHMFKRSIGIFISHAMVSDDRLPRLVVPSFSSIEVAKHNQLVAAWDSADRCLQTFVETFFLLIWVCHCWCICSNYGGVTIELLPNYSFATFTYVNS